LGLGFLEGLVNSQLFGVLLNPRTPRTDGLDEVALTCTARPPDDWECKLESAKVKKKITMVIWPEIFILLR
jgi:hypothetical protein